MALADVDEYVAALRRNVAAEFIGTNVNPAANRMCHFATRVPALGSNPTTSVALDKTSLFSMSPIPDATGNQLRILGAQVNSFDPSVATNRGTLVVVDMLNLSSQLSGTVTTEQTTNLPTAALTRHTSGVGVTCALYVFSQVGSTATTFTVKYTNQSGTQNQVSTATALGATGNREAGRVIVVPLAAGDTGVRSVESVTVTATTGTAGNFGVCLFKPVAILSASDSSPATFDCVTSGGVGGMFGEVHDDACLTLFGYHRSDTSVSASVLVGEV